MMLWIWHDASVVAPFPFDMSPHAKNYSLRQQNDTLSTHAERCWERERQRERASRGRMLNALLQVPFQTEVWVKSVFFVCFSNNLELFTMRDRRKFTLLSPISEWKPSFSPLPSFELHRGEEFNQVGTYPNLQWRKLTKQASTLLVSVPPKCLQDAAVQLD